MRIAHYAFLRETGAFERTNREEAISRYRVALLGLKGLNSFAKAWQLFPDAPDAYATTIDVHIIDRLTLLLIRGGRRDEAAQEHDAFVTDYPSTSRLQQMRAVSKRIEKLR
jgi:hypothetical protein